MMAQPKPHLSITLPRSFEFHNTDGQEQVPQTPAPQPELSNALEPPAPPRQTFKLRRRRPDNNNNNININILDALDSAPLPTIEMTEAGSEPNYTFGSQLDSELSPGHLAPRPSYLRLLSPPRTPASQLTAYSTDSSESNEWYMINDVCGNPIERPLSACSNFSDSSAASFGSSNASCSLGGGSCTSPESDTADPFSFHDMKPKRNFPPSHRLSSSTNTPTAKRVKTTRHPKWTAEMDNHLWIKYMIYVQDPRVTPFKMLPGTPPPLGVCHRVAREAKRSWKGHRTSQGDRLVPRISIHRVDPPENEMDNQGGNTPTPNHHRPAVSKWPRSEAATRRRLRYLCKRKPSLSAHYMRLLNTRSPSPFESSSSPAPNAHPTPDTSVFSSRDMDVSLVAATAPSMQADGPLAQLSRESQPPPTPAPAVQRPTDWFARIGRSQARASAHQKSQSLHITLGLNTWSGSSTNSFERGSILASPFDSDVGRDQFLQNMSATQSLGRGYAARHGEHGHPLNSPLELDGPMPTVRSLKRRFGVVEESAAPQQNLQNIFATPPSTADRPMRHRGFSLGDMGVTTPNIASFFTQPDHQMEEAPEARANVGYLTAPRSQEPPRLGSPFEPGAANTRFNTFPRRFTPQEPDIQDLPFQEKLFRLAAATPKQN